MANVTKEVTQAHVKGFADQEAKHHGWLQNAS